MSCGVGHRCGSDLVLQCLWCRLAAVASIRSLAWEPPYATGTALKKKKFPGATVVPLSQKEVSFSKLSSINILWITNVLLINHLSKESHIFRFPIPDILSSMSSEVDSGTKPKKIVGSNYWEVIRR